MTRAQFIMIIDEIVTIEHVLMTLYDTIIITTMFILIERKLKKINYDFNFSAIFW